MLSPSKNRQTLLQDILEEAISKARSNFAEQAGFQEQLESLPKKLKELDARPYFFIFLRLSSKKQLVEFTLKAIQALLAQNFIHGELSQSVVELLAPFTESHCYLVVQIVLLIREPNLAVLQFYFDILATVALPDDTLRQFKTLGYVWLARIFIFTRRATPPLLAQLYQKIAPTEMPTPLTPEHEHQRILDYVEKVMLDMLARVESLLLEEGSVSVAGGKHGLCFMCRKPADFYCKDTKVPVCGLACKNEHLAVLAETPQLASQLDLPFKLSVEGLLMRNIEQKKCPAFSIDLLIAIYLHSAHHPHHPFKHRKILTNAVIAQRLWLLYLAAYSKLGQFFEHVFVSALECPNEHVKQVAFDYFAVVAASPRLLSLYAGFDCRERRLFAEILHKSEPERRIELVQAAIETIFINYRQSSPPYENKTRRLLRAFNHQSELPKHLFELTYGEEYEQPMMRLLIRNEIEIDKEKLATMLGSDSNENLLRLMLRLLVRPLQLAPVDEILREVLYFINFKVSDKVYKLIEILCEEHQPAEPFTADSLFQYCYFIMMIVTELHNPALVERPSLPKILLRVSQFSPELAAKHEYLIREMFARVSESPFNQQTRGILDYYPVVKIEQQPSQSSLGESPSSSPLQVEAILIDNWQLIYETLEQQHNTHTTLIYRCCRVLVNNPTICQAFLQLLIHRISSSPADCELVTAVADIVALQPNAVGCLWKSIFAKLAPKEDSSSQVSPSSLSYSAPAFQLEKLVECSLSLTNDNFLHFCRELVSSCGLADHPAQYVKLIANNPQRIGLISHMLLPVITSCPNAYLQLKFLDDLLDLRSSSHQYESLVIETMRLAPVSPFTQDYHLEVLTKIVHTRRENPQVWQIVGQKCLQLQGEVRSRLAQQLMRNHPLLYHEFLVQKTLNLKAEELTEKAVTLAPLERLEPYLDSLQPALLRMLLLPENAPRIAMNFKYFAAFPESYALMLDCLPSVDQQALETGLGNVLKGQQQQTERDCCLLADSLPNLVFQLMSNNADRCTLLQLLIERLRCDNQAKDCRMILVKMKVIAMVVKSIEGLLDGGAAAQYSPTPNRPQRSSNNSIETAVNSLYEICVQLNTDYPLRKELQRYLCERQIYKKETPTLLKQEIRLFRLLLRVVECGRSKEQSLQRLSREVTKVVRAERSELLRLPLQQSSATSQGQEPGQAQLKESLKRSNHYKESFLEQLAKSKQANPDCTLIREHSTLMTEILLLGFYDESQQAMLSFAGSRLAPDIAGLL